MSRLARIAPLQGADIDLAALERRTRHRAFGQDEVLVDFDETSTDVFFLVAGRRPGADPDPVRQGGDPR